MPKLLAFFPLILTYFIGPVGLFIYWIIRDLFATGQIGNIHIVLRKAEESELNTINCLLNVFGKRKFNDFNQLKATLNIDQNKVRNIFDY